MENKSENRLGILGFILSLLAIPLVFVFGLGMILAVAAIILCIMQLIKKQTGFAIAGLVISIIALMILPMIVIWIFIISLQFADIGQSNETAIITQDFNGITFEQEDNSWKFKKDGTDFLIKFSPKDIDYINIPEGKELEDYYSKPLYIVSSNTISNGEISLTLKNIALRVNSACLSENNCEGPFPIKNCLEDNIIIIKEPDNNEGQRVYFEDKCVFIVAEDYNQIKYYDAFLLKLLKIS